jgi:hypothetical protein
MTPDVKIHYILDKNYTVCGKRHNIWTMPATFDPEKVTCKNCKRHIRREKRLAEASKAWQEKRGEK